MAAALLILEIEQGTTFKKSLTWRTGTPALPVNLAGCTARMQIRERIGAAEALLTLTSENGGIVLGGATGEISINISATQTGRLLIDKAVYSLRITFSDGTVKRLFSGTVQNSLDATHG